MDGLLASIRAKSNPGAIAGHPRTQVGRRNGHRISKCSGSVSSNPSKEGIATVFLCVLSDEEGWPVRMVDSSDLFGVEILPEQLRLGQIPVHRQLRSAFFEDRP